MFMLYEEDNVFNWTRCVVVLRCWPMPHTSRSDESVAEQVTMKSLSVLLMCCG